MKIGLFFGSFNPIHVGHLAIANYMVEFTDITQIWFVVSPHNPLKEKKSLLSDYARLDLVKEAIADDLRFKASDIEFRMPQPSYTIDTLAYLKEKHPDLKFVIIMGSDGLSSFHKWKNADQLIQNYQRYIYPRQPFHENDLRGHENIRLVAAPQIEISSTFIRQAFKEKKDVRHFMPPAVFRAIDRSGYYR
ncbi:MAG: nicotinate-nucleotide adenylyltransferase [Bacteroidota bacterium]|nr:MAG: nicotinate-nucleotide adenylyltransferase [Bacteroidota bacterium]